MDLSFNSCLTIVWISISHEVGKLVRFYLTFFPATHLAETEIDVPKLRWTDESPYEHFSYGTLLNCSSGKIYDLSTTYLRLMCKTLQVVCS